MSPPLNSEHVTPRSRLPVSWWTVGLFAVVLTAADGFWATALRGAVGYIEATQQPFPDWLRYIAVMLPIYGAAVFGALWLAQRLAGGRRKAAHIAVAVLLSVALTTAVAICQIGLMATYDYRTQANQLVLMHELHDHGSAIYRLDPGTPTPAAAACGGVCSAKHQTLDVHMRAIALIGIVLLVTNTMLVLWALALRGGRLWARRRRAGHGRGDEPPFVMLSSGRARGPELHRPEIPFAGTKRPLPTRSETHPPAGTTASAAQKSASSRSRACRIARRSRVTASH